MNHNSIVFRAANPTNREGLLCAHYLDEVAEGFFRLMLGRNYAEIIARAYPQLNHSYSHRNVIFAESDGDIVGMALGFTAEQHHHFSDKPLKEAAGFQFVRMKAVSIIFAPMFRILNTIAENDFYLLSMGVNKEFRGKGIGTSLLNFIEEQARANGSTRLSLDVAAKNVTARRLYEHHGMTIESRWPKRIPISEIRFYRMTKAL